ncbi:MAG: zinc-binding dehydrogenase [Actinobacteria bacterium]|nr:zinc-binding dehydrogenase [Actinomycetota bacterium]
MKALVKYGYGKGETEIRDVSVPKIGDDDILIEVKAAGICGSDIAFDEGGHENLLNPPVTLGHEFSGIIAKKGKNVTEWEIGDRVVSENTGYICGKCYACSTADYLSCPERLGIGYGMDGGFTKYVKIPGLVLQRMPHPLFRIPEGITFEEAAIIDPCANGYKAVVQESRVYPGEDIAVFGVGALGLFSIQASRVAGAANIIAIGLSKDTVRFELAQKLGATHVIMADKEDVLKKVADITSGEGVALVVDCAGVAIVLKQAIEIVRNGGQIVKIGYDANPVNFSLDPVLDKSISIKGHFGYDYISWKNVIKLMQKGLIDMKSMISHRLPLSRWREGFDLIKHQQSIKVILTPED